jgi:multidrug resistance efflux pump
MLNKKILIIPMALITFVLFLAYFLFIRGEHALQSVNASVYGELLEIKTTSSGPVKFVVAEGQKVPKDALLLEIDSSKQEQERLEAEKFIQEQISTLPAATIKILQGYALIPESQQEISTALEQKRQEIDRSTEKITNLSIAHATFQLQMRKLELKKNRIAEEDKKLSEMRTTEELMADTLAKSKEARDEENNARAELETRLRTRKILDQAAGNLSEDQKIKFEAAKTKFLKLAEAEQEITLSKLMAPEDVVVVKSFLQDGAQTESGRPALLLAPENKENFWITAYFSANDAPKILPGMKCKAVLQTEDKLSIPGRITEQVPGEQIDKQKNIQSSVATTGFKITLYVQDAATLARLHDQQKAIVYIVE